MTLEINKIDHLANYVNSYKNSSSTWESRTVFSFANEKLQIPNLSTFLRRQTGEVNRFNVRYNIQILSQTDAPTLKQESIGFNELNNNLSLIKKSTAYSFIQTQQDIDILGDLTESEKITSYVKKIKNSYINCINNIKYEDDKKRFIADLSNIIKSKITQDISAESKQELNKILIDLNKLDTSKIIETENSPPIKEQNQILPDQFKKYQIDESNLPLLHKFLQIKQYAPNEELESLCNVDNFCIILSQKIFIKSLNDICDMKPQTQKSKNHIFSKLKRLVSNSKVKLQEQKEYEQFLLDNPIKETTSTISPTPNTPIEKLNSDTAKLNTIAHIPLKNWGNTCFVNGYINYLMHTLDQNDVEELKKLDSTQNISPHALQVRDVIVKIWQAYQAKPPPLEIINLQHELLCAFTQCGNAVRANNHDIPDFFANAFPAKTAEQLKDLNTKFYEIRQEDVTELHIAMYNMLLSAIPHKNNIFLNTAKSTVHQGKNISTDTKSDKLLGGLTILTCDFTGKNTRSIKEGLDMKNESFISDSPVDWSVEELQLAGINDASVPIKQETRIKNSLVIHDNIEKLTINIVPYVNNDKGEVKLNQEAIDLFEKDGYKLELTVINPQTKQESTAVFKPKCIVCHQGYSVARGHYFAFCYDDNDKLVLLDDVIIREQSKYGILKDGSIKEFLESRTACPVLIEYQRIQ